MEGLWPLAAEDVENGRPVRQRRELLPASIKRSNCEIAISLGLLLLVIGALSLNEAVWIEPKVVESVGDDATSFAVVTAVNATASFDVATYFCFAVSQSSGAELALMREHWAQKRHIFACPGYSLFSDVGLLEDIPVTNIGKIDSPMGSWGSFANAEVFKRAWQHVTSEGVFENFHWTVKVDPDTCFFPRRLRPLVASLDPQDAIYVKPPGLMIGALEVFSRGAIRALAAKGSTVCRNDFGDSAEDGFMQFCMGRLRATDHSSRSLLKNTFDPRDCAVPGFVAYHPMKEVTSYNACVLNATASG